MTPSPVCVSVGHNVTPASEVSANTMQPLVKPYFTGDRDLPYPRFRVADRRVGGVVGPGGSTHPQPPPRGWDRVPILKIILWPENEDRVVGAHRSQTVNLLPGIGGRRPVHTPAHLSQRREASLHAVDPVPDARFASRQLFDQCWKLLKRADGSVHFRIRQRVNESLRASRLIPNLDVNCVVDEKQRTPDFHGRQRTPSEEKESRLGH